MCWKDWEKKGECRAPLLDGEKPGSPGQSCAVLVAEGEGQGIGRKNRSSVREKHNFTDIFTTVKHFVNLQ